MLKSILLRTLLFFGIQVVGRLLLVSIRGYGGSDSISQTIAEHFYNEMDWLSLVIGSLIFSVFWWYVIKNKKD